MRVCAIVVTYNRKECLKKQIYNILEKQEFTPDAYYIIDNNSVDGTNELIDSFCEYSTNCKIIYVQLKENIGGAGGFYTGLKKAYEDGYDWYILMDDDGMPKNEKCFSEIINKIQDNGWDSENKYLINSLVVSDDIYLSFGLGHHETIDSCLKISKDGLIKDLINPFNGTFVSNGLVNSIGFPNKDFFIKGDEVDYCRRAKADKACIYTVIDSLYFHPKLTCYMKKKVLGHEMYVFTEKPWKEYYNIRNQVYSLKNQRKYKECLVQVVKRVYCCLVTKCKKYITLKMIFKGFFDGIGGKLGASVKPD